MKIFILCQRIWNGTIVLNTITSAYATRELAEKCREKVIAVNDMLNSRDPENAFPMTCEIEEIEYYQNENEIPILNTKTV